MVRKQKYWKLLQISLGVSIGLGGCTFNDSSQIPRIYEEISIQRRNTSEMAMSRFLNMPSQDFPGVWLWQTPKGWKETVGEGLRLASFQIIEDGDILEGSIVRFPGTGGDIEANVTRWMKQLKIRPLTGAKMQRYLDQLLIVKTKNKYPVTIVDFIGSLSGNVMDNNSMLGSVIQAEGHKIFVKLTGDRKLLKKQRENFIKLNESMEYQFQSNEQNENQRMPATSEDLINE